MGGVNTTRDYAETMGFGHWDAAERIVKVDDPLLQGGIVAVYYLPGTLVGALWGGWLGDRYGRISTLGFGCLWTILGAILQSSAQNANWMFCGKSTSGVIEHGHPMAYRRIQLASSMEWELAFLPLSRRSGQRRLLPIILEEHLVSEVVLFTR